MWGLSEVSPFSQVKRSQFLPYDPVQLMFLNGWIDHDEMTSHFKERMRACLNYSREHSKPLLIREHTHPLFFEERPVYQGDHFSWFFEQQRYLFDTPPAFIVTVRDPVDSWLGLRASFPRKAPYDFDDYCRRYQWFVEAYERLREQIPDFGFFRYEDFIHDPDAVYDQVESTAGLTRLQNDPAPSLINSSGNSGRQSDSLGKRSRRPFSLEFLKTAEASVHYRELAQALGYPHCCDAVGLNTRVRASLNSVRKTVRGVIGSLVKPLKSLARNSAVSD